jgi:hypothetical protein
MTKIITNRIILQVINIVNQLDLSKNELLKNKISINSSEWVKIKDQYDVDTYQSSLDNCILAENGALLRDDKGNLSYTPEGEKKRLSEIEIIKDKSVYLNPYYCPLNDSIKEALGVGLVEIFSGILFKESDVEKYINFIKNEGFEEEPKKEPMVDMEK